MAKLTIRMTEAQVEAAIYAIDLYTDNPDSGRKQCNKAREAQVILLMAARREVPFWLRDYAPKEIK